MPTPTMTLSPRQRWDIALSTNATSSSFVAKAYTTTEPVTVATAATAARVLTAKELGDAKTLRIMPYIVGSDDNTLNTRVIGWSRVERAGVADGWMPVELCVLASVHSTSVGAASSAILNTERFPDAITATTPSNTSPSAAPSLKTVTANTACYAELDISGWEKIEINFDMGTATSGNAMWMAF